ncbi:MAG: fatty acid desaturase [Gammaproteobacteria bacterium]|nr:fatty acid desaturase [Gammaproteobacteria bacterium]
MNVSNQPQQKPNLIWLNVLVFLITFLVAAIGVPFYAYVEGFDSLTIAVFFLATGFCGMSITAGYHRLWSHNAYKTPVLIRIIYAIGGAFAVQNSALHWCSDHRIHHQYVDDNEKDPYSAGLGFWHSHIGWMLREYQAQRYHDYKNVPDLQRDPIVMWQHRNYLTLVLLTNFGIPIIFGLLNGNLVGSILLIGFMRLVVSHHVTFFINSLAHMWGSQPYSDKNSAKDNPIVALLTYGEGYHNFHHAFQYDYRNAIKWWQFDPTKWLIKSLSLIGLASHLKKIPDEKIITSVAQQQLVTVQNYLSRISLPNKKNVQQLINTEYEDFIKKMNAFYNAKKAWAELTKNQFISNTEKTETYKQYLILKEEWKFKQSYWQQFIHQYA